MNEVFFQLAVLLGVWSNVTLGIVALYDRRKKNVHSSNEKRSSFFGLP